MATREGVWHNLLQSLVLSKSTTYKSIFLIAGDSADHNVIVNKLNAINNVRLTNDELLLLTSSLGNPKDGVSDTEKFANDFGFGYSFVEFKDENKDMSSHLDIYTIVDENYNDPLDEAQQVQSEKYYKDLIELFMGKFKNQKELSYTDLLVVPILNVNNEPCKWLRFLHRWLKILKSLFYNETRNQELLQMFKVKNAEYLVNGISIGGSDKRAESRSIQSNMVTLMPGECDAPLGFQLLISVVNSGLISRFEQSKSVPFSTDTFEYIQQVLRIIALKHGGSLIYVPSADSKNSAALDTRLISLIASILDFDATVPVVPTSTLPSLLASSAKKSMVPELVDQQHILIPFGYDTVGKVSTVNEQFDISSFSEQWDILMSEASDQQVLSAYENVVPLISPKNNDIGVGEKTLTREILHQSEMTFDDFLKEQYTRIYKKNSLKS